MKVTAFAKGQGYMALSALRTVWPLQALAQKGYISLRIVDDPAVQEMLRTGDERVVDEADLLVLGRVHGRGGDCPFQKAKDRGAKIVFETDDDLSDKYRDLGRAEDIDATVSWCDAVTVSTAPLGKVMEEHGKPVYVLPNRILRGWYRAVGLQAERQVKGLTIGLVGTRTHFFDWIIVVDALKEIKEKYPHVTIVAGGYPAPYLKAIPDVRFHPPVAFDHYPALLASVDIRLLPLDLTDPFNESKSGVGAMEIMASTRMYKGREQGGIPVATDCPQYRENIVPRGTGMLVENTTEAWIEALEYLLSNKGRRRRMAIAAHEAAAQFDISVGLENRLQAYREVIGAH